MLPRSLLATASNKTKDSTLPFLLLFSVLFVLSLVLQLPWFVPATILIAAGASLMFLFHNDHRQIQSIEEWLKRFF